MSKAKAVSTSRGYCVVPLEEVSSDWKKVVLANRLMRLGWDVFRNTASVNHYPAGSFFVPLGGLPVSESKARTYLERLAKGLGISPVFEAGTLPPGLIKLTRPRIAVLYATGEKWALMTMNVLETMEFDVNALSAEDIRAGALDYANMLFIPGGAASDKKTDVGPEGEAKVEEFLNQGGGLLGFCGGAALTSKVKDGWGLLDVERNPGKVPKAMHGPILIKPEKSDHPLWWGYPSEGYPLAPWYGKALSPRSNAVRVLGRYDKPTDDFYVDHELTGCFFGEFLPEEMGTLDKIFDGYANPANLKGMVAIAEGEYGKGRIIVGYPHPETPGLEGGFLLLANAIYHVTQNQSLSDKPWLPPDGKKSYHEVEFRALADGLRGRHAGQVLPVSKDLVKFGTCNLYWVPRPHIAWSYVGMGGFYLCERLESYTDEILRQLGDLPRLLDGINAKRKRLAASQKPVVKDGLTTVEQRLDDVYRVGGQALDEALKAYRTDMKDCLDEWVLNFKKILLYQHLLQIMKEKGSDPALIEETTRKHKKLNEEYVGSWRWEASSPKYRAIFAVLDNAAYYLANLKFELVDISLELDRLGLLAG
ncbi:MAG: hypothetical protein C4555_00540 [Dehalococcoidia bacterium]|nr:MAG: hypothetical protein C4555_00540 [Dehalococcoidia bacterium]